MRRLLSLWLPTFALDRRRTTQPDAPPFGLLRSDHGRLILAAVEPALADQGLSPGQPLAAARALLPDLAVLPEEPAEDREALARLQGWCTRYTPWVAEDPDCAVLTGGLGGDAALFLDITGCAHLVGGEAALAADLTRQLARSGLAAHLAIAATPGGAWALARHVPHDTVQPWTIVPPTGDLAGALADVPVAGLRLPGEAVELLARLGLRRIGQLYALAAASLTPRFGTLLSRRLRQALGTLAEPLSPGQPADLPWVRRAFPEGLSTAEDIERVLALLLEELCALLERRGLGARRLELTCHRLDGSRDGLTVGLAQPGRETKHMRRLFAPQLERLDPGFGFEVVTLAAPVTDPLGARQPGLDSGEAPADDLASLIDRLDNRLGGGSVRRPEPVESHWPEDGERLAAPFDPPATAGRPAQPRPLYLLRRAEPLEPIEAEGESLSGGPPARLVWRRRPLLLCRAEGPERILPPWWQPNRAAEAPRDYYRVEDRQGRRYWIYRAGPRWYLQGLFA